MIFYRISLTHGVTTENRPKAHYKGSEELGKTVFVTISDAKAAFRRISSEEMKRLAELRKTIRKAHYRADFPRAATPEQETTEG